MMMLECLKMFKKLTINLLYAWIKLLSRKGLLVKVVSNFVVDNVS